MKGCCLMRPATDDRDGALIDAARDQRLLSGFAGVTAANKGPVGREHSATREASATVILVMSVTRGKDDRLSGSVGLAGQELMREFSGTLELLRAFEELVPAQDTLVEDGMADGKR